jgi:hypothetical protein
MYAATACLNGNVEEMEKYLHLSAISKGNLVQLSISDPTGRSLSYFTEKVPELFNEFALSIIHHNHAPQVRILMEYLNNSATVHHFVFRFACSKGRTHIVHEIMEKKTISAHMCTDGLVAACRHGHVDVVKLLIPFAEHTAHARCILQIIEEDNIFSNHIHAIELLLEANTSSRTTAAASYEALDKDAHPKLTELLRRYM